MSQSLPRKIWQLTPEEYEALPLAEKAKLDDGNNGADASHTNFWIVAMMQAVTNRQVYHLPLRVVHSLVHKNRDYLATIEFITARCASVPFPVRRQLQRAEEIVTRRYR